MTVTPPNLSAMYLMVDGDERLLMRLIRHGDRKLRRAVQRQLQRQQRAKRGKR